MTLPDSELEKIEDLVVDVANGTEDVGALLYHLKRLRLRYGEQAIILSTQADFVDSVGDRLLLYKKAVDISERDLDAASLIQSAESIFELYVYELRDFENANMWYSKLSNYVARFGCGYLRGTMSQLKQRLDNIGNE